MPREPHGPSEPEAFAKLAPNLANAAGSERPLLDAPAAMPLSVDLSVGVRALAGVTRPPDVDLRQARLLDGPPWVRSLGKLALDVSTEGWRFPVPAEGPAAPAKPSSTSAPRLNDPAARTKRTRIRPPRDAVTLKERLLYLLQPPLENLFLSRQISLPSKLYPYQVEGIAFLMPRWSALLADEMGLGKTIQAIVALRLMLHGAMIRRALIVCPKALVPNWSKELRTWAEDVPFEVIGGDADSRRCGWLVSNCPVKLVNYELLTRDAGYLEQSRFDLVVLDEAQRIKNRESKTSEVVRSIPRDRSWALTGTPIENRPEDLVNLFAVLKPGYVPAETPAKRLPDLTADYILRRRTEEVLPDLPPKIVRDTYVELTAAQRESYELAEKEGIVRLNDLGETLTVQHVFELVMRLKQICNFDPLTGESAKLDQLEADLAEIADSGRKAIVFSQWVEPLEFLAKRLALFGPLRFHGRVPAGQRQEILHRFHRDPEKHVLLMSYGTGGVGLNLQFANYVFLFDRWWNPAVEDQAIKRAHRIGQKQPVFVTRFVTPYTIEGRIVEVLEKKRQLFNDLIDQNEPPSLTLSEAEIFGLFDLRVRPRKQATTD